MKKKVLVISIVVVLLIALLALTFLTGGSKRLYDYDSYEYIIELGQTDGIKINESDIEDEILKAFWSLYDVKKDGIVVNTYRSENNNVLIQTGDKVNIDYVGKKDGVAFASGTAVGYDLVIGSNTFIDGFEDGLIGYKIGDTVSLNITFPEDYGNTELNGAKTVFEVKVNSITRTEYPEFNDENVKAKTEYNTVSEFKEASRGEATDKLLWEKLCSNSFIDSYPAIEMKKYCKQYSANADAKVLIGIKHTSYDTRLYSKYGANIVGSYFSPVSDNYISYMYDKISKRNEFNAREFDASVLYKAHSQIGQELIVLRFMELKPELKIEGAEYRAELEKLYNKQVQEQGFTGSFSDFIKKHDEKALEITIYHDVLIKYLREHCVIVDNVA